VKILKLTLTVLEQVAKMLSTLKNKDWDFVLPNSTKNKINFMIGIFEVSSFDK
jgi:hypothetical protein